MRKIPLLIFHPLKQYYSAASTSSLQADNICPKFRKTKFRSMRNIKIPRSFFTKNRKKLIGLMEQGALAVINSNDEMPRNGDQCFSFRQNSDLFYLTGINQEKTILVLCPGHPQIELREVLFILRPEVNLEIWYGHKYTKDEASEISGISSIRFLDEFDAVFKEIINCAGDVMLNMNEYPKFHTEVPSRDIRFAEKLKQEFPLHECERLAPLLTELRLIKEPDEMQMLKEAIEITRKAFLRTLKIVKPGITEYQVEAEITHEFLWNKASGHAYAPIIASGKNACTLHYISNDQTCQNGQLLLMDFGAEYGNYAADCTRTIPVNGKFTKRQKECYQAVLRVLEKTMTLFTPGRTIEEINKKTNQLLEAEMIRLGLFSSRDVKNQNPGKPMFAHFFMHGVSHFIGLDVHDVGFKYTRLKKGMVLTCEPGLYIPEENIGIRIENNVLVDDKPVNLMKDFPVKPEEIEHLMKR
jgi:Xaa-Pro aminopeptidase